MTELSESFNPGNEENANEEAADRAEITNLEKVAAEQGSQAAFAAEVAGSLQSK
jgi:hypothetical protein